MDCNCGGEKCNNRMWVEEYNKVQIWMVEHNLWEKYKMSAKSQKMIDAANVSQENFMKDELKKMDQKEDYSNWSICDLMTEMKRLVDETKASKLL